MLKVHIGQRTEESRREQLRTVDSMGIGTIAQVVVVLDLRKQNYTACFKDVSILDNFAAVAAA
jgi:hypothetical protein